MKNKVILLTNIPTPYRIPLWNELSKLVDLKVVCISKIEKNRNWKIKFPLYIKFLKSYHFFFQKKDWALHFTFPLALFFYLIKEMPSSIIITGYDTVQYWEALIFAKIFRKQTVLWSGTTLLSTHSKNILVNFLKKIFINNVDSYYTYGTKATEYLENFGVNSSNIITGVNTVDTKYFKENTSNENTSDNVRRFLYIGQLIERKGLYNTISAFSKLKNKNWIFTIIGSGQQEKELKKLVNKYNLEEKIFFVGYKQKNEITKYFSQANILIMPSYSEVWGLVINEALASGLFCLSSMYAGSTFDLIEDGKNGYIIDPYDIVDIALKLDDSFVKEIDKKTIKEEFKININNEAIKLYNAVKIHAGE